MTRYHNRSSHHTHTPPLPSLSEKGLTASAGCDVVRLLSYRNAVLPEKDKQRYYYDGDTT